MVSAIKTFEEERKHFLLSKEIETMSLELNKILGVEAYSTKHFHLIRVSVGEAFFNIRPQENGLFLLFPNHHYFHRTDIRAISREELYNIIYNFINKTI